MADSDDSTEDVDVSGDDDVWDGWLVALGYIADVPTEDVGEVEPPRPTDDPQCHDGEQWYWGRRVVDVELP